MSERNFYIRPYIGPYIGGKLNIDGRNIPYPLVTAGDYLMAKNPDMTNEDLERFVDERNEQYLLLNAIIAMKQSCFLLSNVMFSCDSLCDDLRHLKCLAVTEYNKKYPDGPFDEDFYNEYVENITLEYEKLSDIDCSGIKNPMYVIYEHPLDYPEKYVVRVFGIYDGCAAVTNNVIVRDSLQDCRREIQENGFMHCFPRNPADDKCIVETWMRL